MRSIIDREFMSLRGIAYSTLKNIISTLLCYITFKMLYITGLFSFLSSDFFEYISLSGILVIFPIVLVIAIVTINKTKLTYRVHIFVKSYLQIFKVIMFVFGIIVLYKYYGSFVIYFVCYIELLAVYIILENSNTKIYDYNNIKDVGVLSNYSEKALAGRENLTKVQCESLDKIIKLLDGRKSTDSFNAALIGAWGSGKTSITDTLILELNKRSKEEKKYFILKISTQTFNESKNIVDYVKQYFCSLFQKYGILGLDGRSSVAFLSALADMLGDVGKIKSLSNLMKLDSDSKFIDIEYERHVFADKVKMLLLLSGRKNIVFIIDDADRSDIIDKVQRLLMEFASIEGIISIISLDKQQDLIIRPGVQLRNELDMKIGEIPHPREEKYGYIDKYIHVRVRIDQCNHIEYEESIKKQIVDGFSQISMNENCFIQCNNEYNVRSIFSSSTDYPTTEIIKERRYSSGTYNLLTEIFMYNLEISEHSFGKYFEEIMQSYLIYSQEFLPLVTKMLTSDPNVWDQRLFSFNFQWLNTTNDDDIFDWVMRLFMNANSLLHIICGLIQAVDHIMNQEESIRDKFMDIRDLTDLYEFYHIECLHFGSRTWENRKKEPVQYSGFENIEMIVFTEEELKNININIVYRNFNLVRETLITKLNGVSNYYIEINLLRDFILYLRQILNNYRTFKMQLRESVLYDMNYLDYLISQWQPTNDLQKMFENMKEQFPILNESTFGIPSLSSVMNSVLYNTYITNYGQRVLRGGLENCKIFIFHGSSRNIIVISNKLENADEWMYNYTDIQGNEIRNLTPEETFEINKKTKLIWS